MKRVENEKKCVKKKKKPRIVFLAVFLILIIIAHLRGYKIFGSATLVKNQPLDYPVKIKDITKEGDVVLEMGSEYHIYGITTILPKPLEQVKYFKHQMPTLEISTETPEDITSKIWIKTGLFIGVETPGFRVFFHRVYQPSQKQIWPRY